jgi:hypothetical protein
VISSVSAMVNGIYGKLKPDSYADPGIKPEANMTHSCFPKLAILA